MKKKMKMELGKKGKIIFQNRLSHGGCKCVCVMLKSSMLMHHRKNTCVLCLPNILPECPGLSSFN